MALKFLNNATFAGTVSTGGYLTLNSGDNIPRLIFNGSGDDFFFSNTANYFGLYNSTDSRWDIKVDGAGDTTFAGDITMTQSSGNNMLFIDSSGGGAPVMYMQDSTRKWGQFVSSGDLFFKDETSDITSLKLDGGNGNAIFAGTVLIDGVSNYTGLEVKGTGASRPSVNLSNVTTGILGQVYATESSALVFATTVSGTTALTLDASQNATFAGQVNINSGNDLRLYRSDNATYARFNYSGGSVGLDIDDLNSDGINLQQAGVNKLRIETSGNATFAGNVSIVDDKYFAAGTGGDLIIRHLSSDNSSYIQNYTGDFNIENRATTKSMFFRVSNSSAGDTTAVTITSGSVRPLLVKN